MANTRQHGATSTPTHNPPPSAKNPMSSLALTVRRRGCPLLLLLRHQRRRHLAGLGKGATQHCHACHQAPERVHGSSALVVHRRGRRGRLVVLRGSGAVLRGRGAVLRGRGAILRGRGAVLRGRGPGGMVVVRRRRRGGGLGFLRCVLPVHDHFVLGTWLIIGEPFERFFQLVSGRMEVGGGSRAAG